MRHLSNALMGTPQISRSVAPASLPMTRISRSSPTGAFMSKRVSSVLKRTASIPIVSTTLSPSRCMICICTCSPSSSSSSRGWQAVSTNNSGKIHVFILVPLWAVSPLFWCKKKTSWVPFAHTSVLSWHQYTSYMHLSQWLK